ncbi:MULTISPECIES: TIGR03668 family PPOX class F420-dependent oxidoreductase [Actinoalloteichus]|uniref:Flavin-nucleotide-binding protein n=1 Tax=Actinoalloteichus fjordicus TaxID=1612552 RepID=A0AAC9LHD6_9PSEU|nr:MULTISPECIES: TIGR03668 family PPOX class F420-dependent oxidoreductase [Actinoalloteichus]APU17622.1 putative flavin-nucleotide-binding protein [Actinoalloteichus fjordicus]APU23698.1 putative flavin-nucleotide-binding protein [Actinoalloteichus sp. GBA129-24]
MRLDLARCRRRFESCLIARLGTIDAVGRPQLVPVTFTMMGESVYLAVDQKPKSTRQLARLRNIRRHPAVSLLVDHYEPDWSQLWWVRVDGTARIEAEPAVMATPLRALAAKYPQYRTDPPAGPVIRIDVDHWSGWSAH